MAFSLSNRKLKAYGSIVGIDLGGRTTKAVLINRGKDGFIFSNYVIQDTPVFEKTPSAELIGDHLQSVVKKLDPKIKKINVTIGGNDSIVRIVDLPQLAKTNVPVSSDGSSSRTVSLPQMAIHDMRLMLKHSSKIYLQQELIDYVYDCYILPQQFSQPKATDPDKKTSMQKIRVVVAGAKKSLVDMYQEASKIAGVTIENLVPEVICPLNAFEYAQPDDFHNAVVALVDIGFKKSSISILIKGELVLNRIVNTGGDTLTATLAESMSITYVEAENIKIGMPQEVKHNLEPIISSLARELRASVDFCEHQFNTTIDRIYLSGGTVRSDFFVNSLQNELMAPCRVWNPVSFMELALPPQLVGECENVAPMLAVAVGAAVCSF